ncbi:uncharacterized protein BXZ73DRAFT_95077 [Epithele typhae]|uniref:uncharacterized protein n=1 Tax=Epithele typhae TaxID=378194 RepID=UPI002008C859|nr:uncharacterized protein BXZ73DRAFT_95077 [Epithele typhae]KAH9901693.1 hypothetical protein BXZ73DRAFT_95077 [Epithele typhae]
MLRQSDLKGVDISKLSERIITSLFADDTMIYLGPSDSIEAVNKITDTFCLATTARFNKSKTEYLPLGSVEHRNKVVNERKFNGSTIPDDASIIKDDGLLRTLGAMTGHNPNANEKWELVLERTNQIISAWAESHPSYRGKELITKALVMSLGFYLSTVNGMPPHIADQLEKQIKDFVWDGKAKGYTHGRKEPH